jgi:hypothetical protein
MVGVRTRGDDDGMRDCDRIEIRHSRGFGLDWNRLLWAKARFCTPVPTVANRSSWLRVEAG